MDFAQRLKELREKRGLSQEDLATSLMIPRSTITHYENPPEKDKQRHPRTERLRLIANFFNVSVDYLLGYTDDPSPTVKPQGDLRSQFPNLSDIDPDLLRRFAKAVKEDPFQELFFDNILSASKEEREDIVKELLELRKKYRNRPHPPGDEGPSAWDIIKKK